MTDQVIVNSGKNSKVIFGAAFRRAALKSCHSKILKAIDLFSSQTCAPVLSPDHTGRKRRTPAGGEASWHRRSKTFGISGKKVASRLPIQGEPEERTPSGDNSVERDDFSKRKMRIRCSFSNGAIINLLKTPARRRCSVNAVQTDLSGPKTQKMPFGQIGRLAGEIPIPGLPNGPQETASVAENIY